MPRNRNYSVRRALARRLVHPYAAPPHRVSRPPNSSMSTNTALCASMTLASDSTPLRTSRHPCRAPGAEHPGTPCPQGVESRRRTRPSVMRGYKGSRARVCGRKVSEGPTRRMRGRKKRGFKGSRDHARGRGGSGVRGAGEEERVGEHSKGKGGYEGR